MDLRTALYNACHPLSPATPEQYVDCSAARGSEMLAHEFLNALVMADRHLHFLFTGHIGCGKSSELRCLVAQLEAGPLANGKKYLPIYLDALEYLNVYDVDSTDLLLAILAELSDVLEEKLKITLKENYLKKRWREIWEGLQSDLHLTEGEVGVGGVKAKLKMLPTDDVNRKKVREALAANTMTFHYEVNQMFLAAKIALQKKGYHDFILILDSLDRIQRIGKHEEGGESHYEFFVERAGQLTQLEAHIIFTLPLPLARLYSTQLMSLYGRGPTVLPMIKVLERDGVAKFQEGRARLREILEHRLKVCEQQGVVPTADAVFTPDALEFLVTYCGGHVRQFMQFVQYACTATQTLPMTLEDVQRGMASTVNNMSASVRKGWWEKLAAVHTATNHDIDLSDPDYQKMLQLSYLLEYRNGHQAGNFFNKAGAWYGVHPILREFNQFTQAVSDLREPL